MPLIRQTQANLLGGVSQQPASLRAPNECTEQVNCYVDPIVGLSKRPNTSHIRTLNATTPAVAKYHTVYRDGSEKYLVTFEPTGVSATNLLTGEEALVTDPDSVGYGYLSSVTDESQLEVLTVSDTTFVLNKSTVSAMDGTLSAANPTRAIIFLRQGDYSATYSLTVKVSGIQWGPFEVTTWDGSKKSSGLNTIKTDEILASLASKVSIPGVTVTAYSSIVELEFSASADAIDYIATSDSVGDSVLSSIYQGVPRVEGWLPEVCRDGHKVEVVGDGELDADNYWVVFNADGEETGIIGKGRWEETVAPDVLTTIDPATMPHVLTNTGLNTFEWKAVAWDTRVTGDDNTNGLPSFIDSPLNNMFFYQDRLGFLSRNNVILSETGSYYNFFRSTLLSLRDSALVDVASNHSKLAVFQNAVASGDNMMLFSDRAQFILKGGDVFGPRTVQILPITEFESNVLATPEATSRSVIFPFSRGQQSGLREVFQSSEYSFDGVDLTDKVPDYLVGATVELYASTLEDQIIVRTDANRNTLYAYRFLLSGGERVLSSWGKWMFGGDYTVVKHAAFVGNDLYIVFDRAGVLCLEKLVATSGTTEVGLDTPILMDRRITEDALTTARTYAPLTGQTTITLPANYLLSSGEEPLVVRRDTGVQLTVVSSTATTVVVRGDHVTTELFVGVAYEMLYSFSEPLVKRREGNGMRGDYNLPQHVRYLTLQYTDTRTFLVDITNGSRAVQTVELPSATPDLPQNSMDAVALRSGDFRVAVMGRAKDALVVVRNSTPYPSTLTAATWEINFRDRSSRR